MADLCAHLINRAIYLGDGLVPNKVAWVREGKADKLVLPNVESTYAVLLCITEIDTNSYWLTSDANYQGPNSYVKKIVDAKASCIMMKPMMEFFSSEWQSVLANLRSVMSQIAKPGSPSQGLFAMQTSTCFKVCYVLFTVSHNTSI